MADYNISGCLGSMSFSPEEPLIPAQWEPLGTWPAWITLVDGIIRVFNAQMGVTNLVIYNTLDPESTATVQITTTNCDYEDGPCVSYPLYIFWLNQDGGFSSYTFSPKKTYGVDIGGSGTYKDADLITRYAHIDNIYDTFVQPSGYIPESHVDLLKGLRYSQQAWVYVPGLGLTDDVVKEIFNYTKSFELKRQRNGLYKYDFEFSYSKELLTQNG